MGIYDQAARSAAILDPKAVLERLFAKSGMTVAFSEWLVPRSFPLPAGPDREADAVAVVEEVVAEGESPRVPLLVVHEFQREHEDGKMGVLWEEAAIFHTRARHPGGAYRVVTAMVYLTGGCPEPEQAVAVGDRGWSHRPLMWEVSRDVATTALDDIEADRASWGLMMWVPLMAGADTPELYRRWDVILTVKVTDSKTRAGMRQVAKHFSELRGTAMIWDTNYLVYPTESPLANELIETGMLEKSRATLVLGLRMRFPGPTAEECVRVVETQKSQQLLDHWQAAIYRVATIDEFVAVMRG